MTAEVQPPAPTRPLAEKTDRKIYIAVDFDGTIVKHEFPDIGPPVPHALWWLKAFQEDGATLILWTMRSAGQPEGDMLAPAVEYCASKGVVFDLINENPQSWTRSPKAYAHRYIDDSAAGCPLVFPRNGRPYVDWRAIGPIVLAEIKRLHGRKT